MNHTTPVRVWMFLLLLSASARAQAESKWTVHEWGTFTSLQDEAGEAIGGINTDDEPVPQFVHRLANFLLLLPTEIPTIFFQGAPSCHPDVTMRLETPVIYFHPPKPGAQLPSANVQVKFRGGWLTEFYPDAHPETPGFKDYDPKPFGAARLFQFGPLRASAESRLTWDNLKIGGTWPMTNTAMHVWTSPRAVQAALVQTTNGESEKFLFYRGVAHLQAPLKISRDVNTGELLFRNQLEELPAGRPLAIRSIWLVDIQPGGKIAFRSLPSLALDRNSKRILAHTPAVFTSGDFSSGNLEKLKASLQAALISEGLFADEARALLNTWELSYFKSAGLRVFFTVPRAWTDFYLPLEMSPPADINRVMVGRIELVTPDQRKSLKEIAGFSAAEILGQAGRMQTNFCAALTGRNLQVWEQLNTGGKLLADFISVPQTYQTYLDLGRFRNALILDEARRHRSAGLTNFISTYRLQAYRPLEAPSDRKN